MTVWVMLLLYWTVDPEPEPVRELEFRPADCWYDCGIYGSPSLERPL